MFIIYFSTAAFEVKCQMIFALKRKSSKSWNHGTLFLLIIICDLEIGINTNERRRLRLTTFSYSLMLKWIGLTVLLNDVIMSQSLPFASNYINF